jgi:hypothetical protein
VLDPLVAPDKMSAYELEQEGDTEAQEGQRVAHRVGPVRCARIRWRARSRLMRHQACPGPFFFCTVEAAASVDEEAEGKQRGALIRSELAVLWVA